MLPDKKILNGKKITKTATKLSQTTLLTKLWTNGNRTRYLLSTVLYTKGYLNGRIQSLFENITCAATGAILIFFKNIDFILPDKKNF